MSKRTLCYIWSHYGYRVGTTFNILLEPVYYSLKGLHVERPEDTKNGEGLETPREPAEPGDVS